MAASDSLSTVLTGTLHVEIAFDWGDEIDLERAAQLAPSHSQELARRHRTPASFNYRAPPLRFPLGEIVLQAPGFDGATARLEASVFDFAVINVRVDLSLAHSPDELRRIVGDPDFVPSISRAARQAAEPLYLRLLPAIKMAGWRELVEDYVIVRLDPECLPGVDALLTDHAGWLAGVLRLESEPLSAEQIAEALGRRISYSPTDLVVIDWGAAVVVDRDCEETLQTLEFANLQLLEFRLIDQRLDQALAHAYGLIHSLAGSRRYLFWKSQDRPLRILGDLRIETEALFERAGNALKLVGDQYLSRVYSLAAGRLHLEEWSASIKNSLEVTEGVYQILSDQAAAGRLEAMELIVILLIAVEIVMSLFVH